MSQLLTPMSQPSTPGSQTPTPTNQTAASITTATMPSSDTSHSRARYAHVPILTKYNFLEWQVGIRAYLRPRKHLQVIKAGVDANGVATTPVPPTDAVLLEKWELSEEIVMGVIVATALKMHLELVSKLEDGSAWNLWSAIKGCHLSSDMSL